MHAISTHGVGMLLQRNSVFQFHELPQNRIEKPNHGDQQETAANGIADNNGMRCVPDAAMDADPQSGYSIICAGQQVLGRHVSGSWRNSCALSVFMMCADLSAVETLSIICNELRRTGRSTVQPKHLRRPAGS